MRKKKPAGKQKRSAREKVDWKALEIVHPEAAGIDVGGSEHWVAVSPDRDPEPVRRFGCFTADLREMARWLVDAPPVQRTSNIRVSTVLAVRRHAELRESRETRSRSASSGACRKWQFRSAGMPELAGAMS